MTILLVIIVIVPFFGYQRGECIDYTTESGAVSTCSSGPVLGMAGLDYGSSERLRHCLLLSPPRACC